MRGSVTLVEAFADGLLLRDINKKWKENVSTIKMSLEAIDREVSIAEDNLELFDSITPKLIAYIIEPKCQNSAVMDSCEFYNECMETAQQCGGSGFPLKDGMEFCNAGNSTYNSLSEFGQRWKKSLDICIFEEGKILLSYEFHCAAVQESHTGIIRKCLSKIENLCPAITTDRVALYNLSLIHI